VPWTPEEGRRSFIGGRSLEDRDEGAMVILGGGSKGVSI